jgi:hypothetical protein
MKAFSSFCELIFFCPRRCFMGDFPIQANSDSPTVKTYHALIYSNERIVIIQCGLIKFQKIKDL